MTGDVDQLEQLLINLVRNAVDAALETGGAVTAGWRVDANRVELFGGRWATSGISLWTYTAALSMLLVLIVSPVLGAIADLSRDNPLNRAASAARRVFTDRRVVAATTLYAVYQVAFFYFRLA